MQNREEMEKEDIDRNSETENQKKKVRFETTRLAVLGAIIIGGFLYFGPIAIAESEIESGRECFGQPVPASIVDIVSRISRTANLPQTPKICLASAQSIGNDGTSSVSTNPTYGSGESAIFISTSDLNSPHLEAILAHEVGHIINGDSYGVLRHRGIRKINCQYGQSIELDADLIGAKMVGFEKMISLFEGERYAANCGANPHPSNAERVENLKVAQKGGKP